MYLLKLCGEHYHVYSVLKIIVGLWCQTSVIYRVMVYCMQGVLYVAYSLCIDHIRIEMALQKTPISI